MEQQLKDHITFMKNAGVEDFDMTIKVTHIVYDTIDNVDKDLPTELVFDIDGDTDDIEDDIVSAIHNITGFRRRVKSYKWTEVVD